MKTLRILSVAALLSFASAEVHAAAELTVSPTTVDFGPVSIAGPPAMSTVQLTNIGTSSVTVNGLTFGCPGFGASGAFPAFLGNGQSMIVFVSFDPTARGSAGCGFTVQDSDPNVDTFQLMGIGTAPFVAVLDPPFPMHLFFNDQQWDGGIPQTRAITIKNTGNETIQASNLLVNLQTGTDFSLGSPEFPIAPNGEAQIQVTFDPASEGAKSDGVVIGLTNDLPGEGDRLAFVDGTGTNATTGVEPAAAVVGLRLLGANPVTSATRFSYGLPGPGRVKLALFDTAGRLVQALYEGSEAAGRHEWTWSRASSSRSGVYYVRLSLEGRTLGTTRIVVLKGLQ